MGRARTNAEKHLNRTLSEMRHDRMRHSREAMTDEQVETAMRGIVAGRLERDGKNAVVSLEDFQSANLPMEKVRPIAQRVVADAIKAWRGAQ